MNRVFSIVNEFQHSLGLLWRAFLHPRTPFHLKAIMLAVAAYVISPVDLLPDFLAVLGWVDDVLLVAFAINWITVRLPDDLFDEPDPTRRARREAPRQDPYEDTGPVIDGQARRN